MDVRPLRSEADYDWALAEIERYFEVEPQPGTADADRFDILADLVEAYEARHWPIDYPDAVEALREGMAQKRFSQSDLARILGSRSRASEILNRKRAMTIDMAHRIFTELHIPAEILIRPYHLDR